jgi:hypothetical protein
MQAAVRERAAAFGIQLGGGESFSSIISSSLSTMHDHSAVLAPGTAVREALLGASTVAEADAASSPAVSALTELEPPVKERILLWAQAHTVLLQVFGPREPLERVRKREVNRLHFERLSTLCDTVISLGETMEWDEAYFAPLRDIDALQKALHDEAALSKAAHEWLVLFSMNARRRPRRAKA